MIENSHHVISIAKKITSHHSWGRWLQKWEREKLSLLPNDPCRCDTLWICNCWTFCIVTSAVSCQVNQLFCVFHHTNFCNLFLTFCKRQKKCEGIELWWVTVGDDLSNVRPWNIIVVKTFVDVNHEVTTNLLQFRR